MHIDLTGKRAVVTGGNGGIGYETVKGLVQLGAEVLFTGRDSTKCEAALRYLKRDTGKDTADFILADFAKLADVDKVAQAADGPDILINNAGAMTADKRVTEDGNELQWQTNFLAPMMLALAVGPNMPAGGRIVNVSSGLHKNGTPPFSDPLFETRSYDGMTAYADTKLALIMASRALAAQWGSEGPRVNCVHPGLVRTQIARDAGWMKLAFSLFGGFFLSPRRGAATSLYVACSPLLDGVTGKYFVRSLERAPAEQALDDAMCAQALQLATSATKGHSAQAA